MLYPLSYEGQGLRLAGRRLYAVRISGDAAGFSEIMFGRLERTLCPERGFS
jgi:hypothetical protein